MTLALCFSYILYICVELAVWRAKNELREKAKQHNVSRDFFYSQLMQLQASEFLPPVQVRHL